MNLKQRYKSNSKKRVIRFFVCYSFVAFFFILYNSFGQYTTIESGSVKTEIAKWQIKINDIDIINQNSVSNEIKLVATQETKTSDSKLAPGQSGFFDITINPDGTDVSIEYDINFNTANLPAGINLVNYEILEENKINTIQNNIISGEINLSESKGFTEENIKTVRVVWEWDENDTIVPSKKNIYAIVVTVTARQKLS